MDYKPKHPSLTVEHKNTLTDHCEAVQHLNSLSIKRREDILSYIEESMPAGASKHETAIWCHIQHTLATSGVLAHPINAYVCYQLEKHSDKEGLGFLEEIFEQFK
jgi:hypothetical protein